MNDQLQSNVLPPSVTIDVDLIDESGNNPNQMAAEKYAALVESIRRFGFLLPVLVRPDPITGRFILADGHHRLKAAKELGFTKITAIVVQEDESVGNVLQLAMNNLRGEINLASAGAMLADLEAQGFTMPDLILTGFSESEVNDLIAATKTDAPDLHDMGAMGTVEDKTTTEAPTAFILEIQFDDAKVGRSVKRKLQKHAGKGNPLYLGLMALLGEVETKGAQ